MQDQGPLLDLSRMRSEANGGADGPLAAADSTRWDEGGDGERGAGREEEEAEEEWLSGQRWLETAMGLENLGMPPDRVASLLTAVPQLLRLEPSVVLGAAEKLGGLSTAPTEDGTGAVGNSAALLSLLAAGAAVEAGGRVPSTILETHPLLLSYTPDQLEGGLAFLATMMAMPRPTVDQACTLSPDLLLMGVAEAINAERVSTALGTAAKATSQAHQRHAAAQAAALRRRQRDGGV